MKTTKLVFLIFLIFLAACKPGAKVVQIETGVEAELNSEENFSLDFGEKIISGSYIGIVTLSNSGKFSIGDLVATPLDEKGNLIYRGGVFPGTNGSCRNSIQSNTKCTIEFEFKPDHEGHYSYSIDLDYNTGISSKKKKLTIKAYAGSAAFLKFDDASDFDFGIHEISEQVERTYTVLNSGGLTAKNLNPLFLEAPFYYKGGAFPGVGGTCQKNIIAYSSCTIVIHLKPTVNENAVKNMAIDYFNGNGLVTFSGSVQALIVSIEADLSILASGTQDFGSATFQKGISKKFKIMNKGYRDATAVNFIGAANFVSGTNTCNGIVEKSKYCEFNVLFSPNVAGIITEDFLINYDSGKQIKTLSLSSKGKGITPAILSFDVLNVNDFGNQGINSEKILSFTIKNTGDFTATGVNISSTSSDFVISLNTCLSVMLKNSSCTVQVKFNPLTAGDKVGDIKIEYNNGSKIDTSVSSLTGKASALAFLKYSDAHPINGYDFGMVTAGRTHALRILVTNTGLADATNVHGSKFFGTEFNYRGDFDLLSLGKTINSYAICAGAVDPGIICRNAAGTELYLNDSEQVELYTIGVFPDCSSTPGLFCQLSTTGPNIGVRLFAGERVNNDYPVCESTIPTGQTCQVVFEVNAIGATNFSPAMSLNYINDNLFQTDQQNVAMNVVSQLVATLSYYSNFGATLINDITAGYLIPSAYNIGEKIYSTITVTNNGDYSAYFNSIDWADSLQKNFSFDKTIHPSTAPGRDPLGTPGGCEPSGYLGGHSSCLINVWFVPEEAGNPLTDNLKIDYFNGDLSIQEEIKIKGTAAGMAEFLISPVVGTLISNYKGVKLPTVAVQLPGNNVARTITISNVGNGDFTVTDLKFCNTLLNYAYSSCDVGDFLEGSVDTTVPTSCFNQNVAVNDSCTLDILYSPQSVHVTNYFTIMLTYTSSGYTVNKHIYGQLDSADPAVLKFIDSGALGNLSYDFKLQEFGEVSASDLSLENQSGIIDATSVTYSIENDPDGVFSIDSINNSCSATIAGSQNCTIRVNFTPTAIGNFVGTLKATYFNGKESASTVVGLKGTGEPPRSTHKGWANIVAMGDKVNVSNVSDNSRFIEVAWNDMTPKDGYTITGYNIYRRIGDGFYGGGTTAHDYTTSLNASPISTTIKKYKDTTVLAGKVYYYEVRPIIMGFPSRTLDNTREVRITVPFDNMVLVHRWMANNLMCQKLGKSVDISANSRCSYGGIGSKNNFFDIGYDFMVDRFELGADKTSRAGQLPLKDTQANMKSNCDTQGDFTVFNINPTTSSKSLRKRILTRKEFQIAGMWTPTDTDSAIVTREGGLTSSSNCNGANGSSVEITGNNSLCKSYFGIEDAAGNEIEWVSDRIINGIGITDQMNSDAGYELRLDSENKDLAGTDLNTLIPITPPNLAIKDAPCFTVPLGLSLPLNPNTSTCLNARSSSALGAAYFHNNIYSVANYLDMKGLASGGAAYISGSNGLYGSYWLGVTVSIGGRCTLKLDY